MLCLKNLAKSSRMQQNIYYRTLKILGRETGFSVCWGRFLNRGPACSQFDEHVVNLGHDLRHRKTLLK